MTVIADGREADLGSQSADTTKLNFIQCGRLGIACNSSQKSPFSSICARAARTSLICGYFHIKRQFAKLALVATADVVRGRHIEAARRSERTKEFNQVALLLAG